VLAAYISTWYTNQKILQSVQCILILGELVQQLKTQLILDHIRSTVISQLSSCILSLFFLFHCYPEPFIYLFHWYVGEEVWNLVLHFNQIFCPVEVFPHNRYQPVLLQKTRHDLIMDLQDFVKCPRVSERSRVTRVKNFKLHSIAVSMRVTILQAII
jgi:hypothetical protein